MISRYYSAALLLLAFSVDGLSGFGLTSSNRRLPSRLQMAESSSSSKKILVVSPPGGVGEVAALEAAKLGSHVRWFVVSPTSSSSSAVLSAPALAAVEAAGGQVELAGADANSLLLPADDPDSALGGVKQWCNFDADGLVCTLDTTIDMSSTTSDDGVRGETQRLDSAIRVAAREAAKTTPKSASRVAILSLKQDEKQNDEDGPSPLDSIGSLLGKGKVEVPTDLTSAMKGESPESNMPITKIRHGDLFGIPESSPDFSPFVRGPRKEPQIREEYTMRSIRLDPTLSMAGNSMMGSTGTVSSRLAVGEAAARMVRRDMTVPSGSDVVLTSQRGSEKLTNEEWEEEFARLAESSAQSGSAQLFKATFGSVPDVERLADWIATKWAPAVMRTYEIAGIRIGARPVFANRKGEGTVEIVWQQLVDFQSVTAGSMSIEVSETELVASRGPGDASAGFGSVSNVPLNGEDVMVRRLADGISQAFEKGLAVKPVVKKAKKESKKVAPPAPVASSVVASGPVVETAAPPAVPETGPRVAGARRSAERSRGRRRKTQESEPSAPSEASDNKEDPPAFQ